MHLDRLDVYIAIGSGFLALFLAGTMMLAYRGKFPTVQTIQDLATVFNTKGGIILVLLMMWWVTLSGTVAFGIWVIAKGINPQHAVVVMLLGMLVSQAFGNVNGSLFTMFKGEDPKPPAGVSSVTTVTKQSTTAAVTNTLTASGDGVVGQ